MVVAAIIIKFISNRENVTTVSSWAYLDFIA
jgi:hypothetical protein